MPKTVLFLCTGNYYRSRFAEMLFNHLVSDAALDWRAESRGLATDRGMFNIGPISKDTIKRLAERGVVFEAPHRSPIQCSEADLANADLVIALKEDEHRQMLEDRHPTWPDRVEYWHVHDLDMATADAALTEIALLVDRLIARLQACHT